MNEEERAMLALFVGLSFLIAFIIIIVGVAS
jgi:hypothetical protein